MILEKLQRILTPPAGPDREFIVSGYSIRDVHAMAADIRSAFASKKKNVLIFTENKAVIAASVIASLTSGFDVVLPHALSRRALAEIRGSIGFDAVVTDRHEIESAGVKCLVPAPDGRAPLDAPPARKPDVPFLTFFTGGSTGKPRAWSKTAGNVFGEALHLSEKFGFTEDDRVLSTAPAYHIYGFLFSVLAPLVSGSKTFAQTPSFPEEIRRCLENESPTVFAAVPMHYRILRSGDIDGGTLRIAFSSAGKLDLADGDRFHEKTGVELFEIYGSTETGGVACRCRARGENHLTPFDAVDWKIQNERLFVRSPFISPEIEKDAEGFFRTGDRAVKIDGQRFSLLGRVDGIVKVGGKRVDLEQVRNKIGQIPGVNDADVFSTGGVGRESVICAVVEGAIGADELKNALSAEVEPHAMPRRFRLVEKMPVSASGKYDRKAMEALFDTRRPGKKKPLPARGA